jgi:hypothetical protein
MSPFTFTDAVCVRYRVRRADASGCHDRREPTGSMGDVSRVPAGAGAPTWRDSRLTVRSSSGSFGRAEDLAAEPPHALAPDPR